MPYWCGDCRSHFSVRIGTVLYCAKVPYQKWAIAIHLHHSHPQGISAMQLARDIRVSYKTAWFMLQRIRECWPDPEPLDSKFLEVDESWFGGDDKKRHRNKKFGNHWRKGRVLAVGGIDRDTGRADARRILKADHKTVAPFVEKNLDETGTLCSDEAPVYAALKWPGRHEIVNHNKGEYVRGDAHTNTIESLWAKAKRTIRDTYRHVSPKFFPRYLREIVGRHKCPNRRNASPGSDETACVRYAGETADLSGSTGNGGSSDTLYSSPIRRKSEPFRVVGSRGIRRLSGSLPAARRFSGDLGYPNGEAR